MKNIYKEAEDFTVAILRNGICVGTGWFVESDCDNILITAKHVVQKSGEYFIQFSKSKNPYDISAYKTETDGITDFGERKHWLNDDYVKFIRFSEQHIQKDGKGVLAFITNNGYLDNPTFRGMRTSLLRTFDKIYIVNLHGNSLKQEKSPSQF